MLIYVPLPLSLSPSISTSSPPSPCSDVPLCATHKSIFNEGGRTSDPPTHPSKTSFPIFDVTGDSQTKE